MRGGFSVSEMMIVVVVMTILALIGTAAYSGWRRDTVVSAMEADLRSAAQAMEQYRNFHGTYPDGADHKVPHYNGGPVNIVYVQQAGREEFCLELAHPEAKMHLRSGSEPRPGGCT